MSLYFNKKFFLPFICNRDNLISEKKAILLLDYAFGVTSDSLVAVRP